MPTRTRKKADETDTLTEALDCLDTLHAALVTLADGAGVEAAAEDTLTTSAGDDYPGTTFVVGAGEDEDLPRSVSLALSTRLTLDLSAEDAEALAFVLLRGARQVKTDESITIELDGRYECDRTAVAEIRRALKANID